AASVSFMLKAGPASMASSGDCASGALPEEPASKMTLLRRSSGYPPRRLREPIEDAALYLPKTEVEKEAQCSYQRHGEAHEGEIECVAGEHDDLAQPAPDPDRFRDQ